MEMLNDYADYITYEKQNPFAGDAIHRDAIETGHVLSRVAASLSFCKSRRLAKLGYRKILFQKHKYLFIYRLDGNVAIVEAVYHQSQDYENKFSKEQGIL